MNTFLYRKLSSTLSNGDVDYCLDLVKKELTCEEADVLLRFLISWHHDSHELASRFHQQKSDNCPMEETESEKYEDSFASFVFEYQAQSLANFKI